MLSTEEGSVTFMRVLLVQPPYDLFPDDERQAMPPLGLAYIAAALEQAGHDVAILDCVVEGFDDLRLLADGRRRCGLQDQELRRRLTDFGPQVVGVSCLFSAQAQSAHYVCALVKAIDPAIVTIMGGAHPSALAHEVLIDSNVDAVCLGEGEMAMVDFLKTIADGSRRETKGIITRQNPTNARVTASDLVQDLDSLPMPARHLLPMNLYFKHKAPHGGVVRRNPCTNLITSRGCPARCSFCSIHTVWGRRFRSHSSTRVLDELEHLVRDYGVREVQFEDDNLTLNKRRMIEICRGMIDRKLDLLWTTPNGVAIWALDEPLIALMRKSGCYHITIAVESASDRVLRDLINKPVNLTHVPRVVRACRKAGMGISAFFVVGFPGETKKEIAQTFDYAMSMGADTVNFFTATPYPGTRLYRECSERQLMPSPVDFASLRIGQPIITTPDWTAQELGGMVRAAQARFYLHMALKRPNRFLLAMVKKILREPRGMSRRLVDAGSSLIAHSLGLNKRNSAGKLATTP